MNDWRDEIADVIIKVANLISYLLLFELDIAIKSQGILAKVYMKLESQKVEREVAPYIGAVMFLSFNGKEANSGQYKNRLRKSRKKASLKIKNPTKEHSHPQQRMSGDVQAARVSI